MTIIVLFGGSSDERHVSVASAQNIVRALGGRALSWFWTPEGAVHDVAASDLLTHQRPFEVDFLPARPAIFPTLEQALDTLPVEDPLFLLALHGGEGEDGTLQRILERRGIPFTGSGADASAAAFDKDRAKEIVKGRVRVAESRTTHSPEQIRPMVEEMLERHAKIVLKPLAGGSSRGLFFLERGGDAGRVIEEVAALKIPYVIEQFISGRELTVGVIDRQGTTLALPVLEIEVDPGHAFDYEGKYLGQGTREICPAVISEEMAREAQQNAVTAHEALGCEGYSRTDLVAAQDGIWYLETNTLPGLTTSSLVPQELRAAGIEFEDFLEEQVALAMKRASSLHTI